MKSERQEYISIICSFDANFQMKSPQYFIEKYYYVLVEVTFKGQWLIIKN